METMWNAIILSIIAAVFTLIIIIFGKQSYKQPIKSRSPLMIILSSIGNVTYSTVIIMNMLNMLNSEGDTSNTGNILNIIATYLCHPLFFYPYIIRTWRIYTICHVDLSIDPNRNIQNTRKIAEQLKDRHYKNKIIAITFCLIALAIAFSIWKITSNSSEGKLNFMLFDVGLRNIGNGTKIAYFNSPAFIWYSLSFLEEISFAFMILTVIRIHTVFNMKSELVATGVIWIVANIVVGTLLQTSCGADNDHIKYGVYVILIKNFLCFMLSVIVPLFESLKSKQMFLPYGETVECCETVELALSTQTACDYFRKFLEQHQIKLNYLLLYMSIKSYELKFNNAEDDAIKANANQIISDFFDKQAPFKIEERLEQLDNLQASALSPSINMFNCLYPLIIGNLRVYYDEFKASEPYSKLRNELLKTEIAFERLNLAGLN